MSTYAGQGCSWPLLKQRAELSSGLALQKVAHSYQTNFAHPLLTVDSVWRPEKTVRGSRIQTTCSAGSRQGGGSISHPCDDSIALGVSTQGGCGSFGKRVLQYSPVNRAGVSKKMAGHESKNGLMKLIAAGFEKLGCEPEQCWGYGGCIGCYSGGLLFIWLLC